MAKKASPKFTFDRWFNNFTWSRELLGLRPHEITEAFSRAKMAGMQPVGFLLQELENEAKKALAADLPAGMTPNLDVQLGKFRTELLNERQENAIAVLGHVSEIRQLLGFFSAEKKSDVIRSTRVVCAPATYVPEDRRFHSSLLSQRELAENIVEKAMRLALAAIGGDFQSNLMPPLKRGAAALEGSRQKRQDNLNKAIIRELNAYGAKQSAQQILANLGKAAATNLDDDSIVYGVRDDNSVLWLDERRKARETSFKSFQNRVSKLKKTLRP